MYIKDWFKPNFLLFLIWLLTPIVDIPHPLPPVLLAQLGLWYWLIYTKLGMNTVPMKILSCAFRFYPHHAKKSVVRTCELGQQAGLEVLCRALLLKQNILKVYYNRKLHDPTPTGTNVCPSSSIRVGAMSIMLAIESYGLHKWGEIRCRGAHIRFDRNPSISSNVISGRLTRIWQRCYFGFI
jgi:hypothetical protein